MLNKHDYIQWKNTDVYDEYKKTVLQEIDTFITQLVNTAGRDPLTDGIARGRIAGLQMLLDWEPDFEDKDDADSSWT